MVVLQVGCLSVSVSGLRLLLREVVTWAVAGPALEMCCAGREGAVGQRCPCQARCLPLSARVRASGAISIRITRIAPSVSRMRLECLGPIQLATHSTVTRPRASRPPNVPADRLLLASALRIHPRLPFKLTGRDSGSAVYTRPSSPVGPPPSVPS